MLAWLAQVVLPHHPRGEMYPVQKGPVQMMLYEWNNVDSETWDDLPALHDTLIADGVLAPVTDERLSRAEWEATIDKERAILITERATMVEGGYYQEWTHHDGTLWMQLDGEWPVVVVAAVGEETP